MGEPDQTHENPYRSPAVSGRPDRRDLDLAPVDNPSSQTSESKLFVRHMMIVSFLAPSVAFAVLVFSADRWQDCNIFLRLGGAIIFGVYYAVIVLPASLLFGLVTYPFCRFLRASQWNSAILWGIIGSLVGIVCGVFLSFAEANNALLTLPLGAIVGLAVGLLLWRLWLTAPTQQQS